MHIDKCSEAQFKFGVHLGCKKTWPTGTTDYQSTLEQRLVIEPALETNNQLIRSCYYWGGEDKTGVGVGWRVSGGAISLTRGEVKRNKKE